MLMVKMTEKREQIVTKDGSVTFYNDQFAEHYHTTAGAVKEAIVKFAEICNLQEMAEDPAKKEIFLLDVCFGLGYNTAAAIDLIRTYNTSCAIHVIGLENDEQVLQDIQEINPSFACYAIIKEVAREKEYDKNNIHLTLLMGDARETIKKTDLLFDADFH